MYSPPAAVALMQALNAKHQAQEQPLRSGTTTHQPADRQVLDRLRSLSPLGIDHLAQWSSGYCCTCCDRAQSGQPVAMRTRRSRPAPVARSAFVRFCFPPDVIVLAVRWYLRFALSYRDVEELLAERGIQVDHVTIYRWVQRFTPLLADAAPPCRHAVGDRWGVDET